MRKSNLFKGIVCGLMLTAVVGTTVFATTTASVQVDDGDYVCDVEFYYNTFDGIYGTFYATGTPELAKLEVVNDTYQQRGYAIQVLEYNYYSNSVSNYQYDEVTLGVYGRSSVSIARDCSYNGCRYEYTGKSFASPGTTSVIIDSYRCTVYQYN